MKAISSNMDLIAGNPDIVVCEQHRRKPACASAQTYQRLCYSLSAIYHIQICYQIGKR